MMRRTPLKRGTSQLKRTELKPGKSQLRRCSISPVSIRRRQDNAKRTVVVSAMRMAVDGRCARCRGADMPVHGHERLSRAHGGDIIHPDCVVCDRCNGAIEDQPQVSCWNGWKISPKWPHDPALLSTQARDLFGYVVDFEVVLS